MEKKFPKIAQIDADSFENKNSSVIIGAICGKISNNQR